MCQPLPFHLISTVISALRALRLDSGRNRQMMLHTLFWDSFLGRGKLQPLRRPVFSLPFVFQQPASRLLESSSPCWVVPCWWSCGWPCPLVPPVSPRALCKGPSVTFKESPCVKRERFFLSKCVRFRAVVNTKGFCMGVGRRGDRREQCPRGGGGSPCSEEEVMQAKRLKRY